MAACLACRSLCPYYRYLLHCSAPRDYIIVTAVFVATRTSPQTRNYASHTNVEVNAAKYWTQNRGNRGTWSTAGTVSTWVASRSTCLCHVWILVGREVYLTIWLASVVWVTAKLDSCTLIRISAEATLLKTSVIIRHYLFYKNFNKYYNKNL